MGPAYRDDRYGKVGIQRGRLDCGFEEHEPFPITGEDDATAGLRAWHAAVRRGSDEGLYPGLLDGVRAVRAVFAAEESAKTGARVALPSTIEAAVSLLKQTAEVV